MIPGDKVPRGGGSRMLRHAGVVYARKASGPCRPYSALTAADFLRAQAARGANMEADPRGIDYDLFESPSPEYEREKRLAPAVSDTPAPVATMQRVIRQGDFLAASRLFEQLCELGTLLEMPLDEYAHAARWCAASGQVQQAVKFLHRVPSASTHSLDTSHQVAQTLLWLAQAHDHDVIEQAVLTAAKHGFARVLPHTLSAIYQGPFGGSPHRAQSLWCAVVDELRARNTDVEFLTHLYGRVVRAQVRGRHHISIHDTLLGRRESGESVAERMQNTKLVASAVFPLDIRTEALLRGENVRPRRGARMSLRDRDRFSHHARAGDLARMRSVLLGVAGQGTMPSVEHVATLLCMAARHEHVDMPASDTKPAYRVSTGMYLRPLRRRLVSRFPGLWETATLRAREKEGDWLGALRLWQRRFEPIAGVRQAAVDELLAQHGASSDSLQRRTYAAAVARNSERRPGHERQARPRIMPTPYAVATVFRALVRGYGPQAKPLALMYASFVDRVMPGGPEASVACFEAFIAMSSRVDPKRFVSSRAERRHVSQLPTMWTMLRDMQKAGLLPRSTTWTLFLQALARDRSRTKWHLVLRLLRAMNAQHDAPQALPRATPATYKGLLHVLMRVRSTGRIRWRRNKICALLARRRMYEASDPGPSSSPRP